MLFGLLPSLPDMGYKLWCSKLEALLAKQKTYKLVLASTLRPSSKEEFSREHFGCGIEELKTKKAELDKEIKRFFEEGCNNS